MPEKSLFFKKDELKWRKLALLILHLELGKVLQAQKKIWNAKKFIHSISLFLFPNILTIFDDDFQS